MGRNVLFRWSVRLHCSLFRPFSDGFMTEFYEVRAREYSHLAYEDSPYGGCD
jgi:hypothetical protein